ncbi:MAG: hypothetical protein ACI83P_000412 [Janthinobacterium sp.]|jgi:hypothetical protein
MVEGLTLAVRSANLAPGREAAIVLRRVKGVHVTGAWQQVLTRGTAIWTQMMLGQKWSAMGTGIGIGE